MKLVPLILLLSTLTSGKKIKKIKRLLFAIGGIASLARNTGIGKSLRIASQQSVSRGLQYAYNFNTLYTSVQSTSNHLITTDTSPALISAINGITVSTSAIQPKIFSHPAVINQHTIIHRNIAVPVPAPFAVPVPKDVLVPFDTPVVVSVDRPYPVEVPVFKAVPTNQESPVLASTALSGPVFHHPSVAVAQPPLVQVGLPLW